MEERMRKTKTVVYSIWLTSAVCCFTLLPSLVQSQGGTATLTVGDGSGAPGSQGNQITVALNNDVSVGGMQLEICDEDDFMVCAGCQVQDRASGFLCDLNELPDGCCRMLLVDVAGGGLAEGAGPIFSLAYTVATNAPAGECRALNPEDIVVRQDNQDLVDTQSEPGEFCFSSSTTTTSTPCPSKEIYGENSQETQLLRSIRDTVLSQTPEGRKIIALYYQWSPALVKAMQQDKVFETNIRKMIDGLLMLIP
jgi:hypothetical protein